MYVILHDWHTRAHTYVWFRFEIVRAVCVVEFSDRNS